MCSICRACHLYAPPKFTRSSRMDSFGMWNTEKKTSFSASIVLSSCGVVFRNQGQIHTSSLFNFLVTNLTPALATKSWRQRLPVVFSAASSLSVVCDSGEAESLLNTNNIYGMGVNHIDHLVQALHDSAKSFSFTLECHPLARNHQKLTMAWIGTDVDLWYRQIAYKAAVYALLLQAAMELVVLSGDKNSKETDPASRILSPTISLLMNCIESQLHARDPKLVKWFMVEKLPDLSGNFIPLMERWSREDRHSVAATIQAISCCVAIMKLGARRISCQVFTKHLPEMITELLNFTYALVPADILHKLAVKAGFEYEFLSNLGKKILQQDASCDLVFWMDLIQEKLAAALERENVPQGFQYFFNSKVLPNELATLGFFAYLGRKTRFFLLHMGIKDVNEHVENFLCYLECGILFYYPELSSMCVYQLFMEVVTEEIGWLDFYAEIPCVKDQERKRMKQHAIQAEKEIILSTVLNVCSDAFSWFAHFSSKTQPSVDASLVEYVLQSQNMLKVCQVDFLAAYDRPRKLLKPSEPMPQSWILKTMHMPVSFGELCTESELLLRNRYESASKCMPQNKSICSDKILEKAIDIEKKDIRNLSFFARSSNNMISTVSDIWTGTQLLFIDLVIALDLVRKRIFGHSLSKRETKRITKALVDLASIIPIIILMLLPVTAIGHAAMLAAIKKHIPGLIPSPYSREQLDLVKQLKRAKKMGMQRQSCGNNNISLVSNK